MSLGNDFFLLSSETKPQCTFGTLIAPFGFLENNSGAVSSFVLHRFSSELNLLNDVRSYINSAEDFTPASLFIVTWRLLIIDGQTFLVRKRDNYVAAWTQPL